MAASVTLAIPKSIKANIASTYCTLKCTASGFELPNGSDNTTSETKTSGVTTKTTTTTNHRTRIVYTELSYTWTYSPSSSSHEYTGNPVTITFSLSAGMSQNCSATASAFCKKSVYEATYGHTTVQVWHIPTKEKPGWWETTEDYDWGNSVPSQTSRTNYYIGSATGTRTVYAKPETFTWGVSAGGIIGNIKYDSSGYYGTLLASKTYTFASTIKKYINWKNQNGSGSRKDTTAVQKSQGSTVTADWYNTCIDLLSMGASKKVSTSTVIAASHFTDLEKEVNGDNIPDS